MAWGRGKRGHESTPSFKAKALLDDMYSRIEASRPRPAQDDVEYDRDRVMHELGRDVESHSQPPQLSLPEQYSTEGSLGHVGALERVALASIEHVSRIAAARERQYGGGYDRVQPPQYGDDPRAYANAMEQGNRPRRKDHRFLRRTGLVVLTAAVYVASNVVSSNLTERGCESILTLCIPAAGGGMFVDAVPVLGEVTSVRDVNWKGSSSESGGVSVHGPENNPGKSSETNANKLSFTELFKSGIPLGNVTAETVDGEAQIVYGKKSVGLPMSSSRIFDFTAVPVLETKTNENGGKNAGSLAVSQPFTVQKNENGLILTVDPSKITAITSLAGEGDYKVSGNNVARKSNSGDFNISFLDKAPLKSSDASAAAVNPYAKPSKENAATLAKLYDLKNLGSAINKTLTNACINSKDNSALKASDAITNSINQQVQAKVDAMANQLGVRIELHIPKTDYNLAPNAVLAHTIKYAEASGNEAAAKTAGEMKAAYADGAKRFVPAAANYLCTPSDEFIK